MGSICRKITLQMVLVINTILRPTKEITFNHNSIHWIAAILERCSGWMYGCFPFSAAGKWASYRKHFMTDSKFSSGTSAGFTTRRNDAQVGSKHTGTAVTSCEHSCAFLSGRVLELQHYTHCNQDFILAPDGRTSGPFVAL